LVPPETVLKDGTKVKIQHGNAGCTSDKPHVIYVSPSIEYSAHWIYTDPLKISTNEYQYAVFQVCYNIYKFITLTRFAFVRDHLKHKEIHCVVKHGKIYLFHMMFYTIQVKLNG
jgi:hypothetical protein